MCLIFTSINDLEREHAIKHEQDTIKTTEDSPANEVFS